MKTLSVGLLLMASMVLVLVGCSENSAPLLAPNELAISKPDAQTGLAKTGPVINVATGNGGFFEEGKIVTCMFSARRYADESCSGEFELWAHAQDPTLGNKWHGKVMSLKVWYGNTAVIGGVETGQYGFLNTYDVWVTVDNGEGAKNGNPDMHSISIYWAATLEDAQRVWNMKPEDVIKEIALSHNVPESEIMVPVTVGNLTVR
jgi:hypothetical protein